MKKQAFVSFVMAASVAQSSLAAAPSMSPAAGFDAIRAARTQVEVDTFRFDYRIEVRTTGKADTGDSGGVTVADDFVAVSNKSATRLDDYRLCRMLSWSPGGPMANQSCYAGPAFRQQELANRRGLRAMLEDAARRSKGATVPPALQNPYWAEQELAVAEPTSEPLAPTKSADGVAWRLGNDIVVRTSLTGHPFTATERPRIARYLARHVDLHPQVRRAILNAGQLPDQIEIVRRFDQDLDRETLHFSNFRRERVVYPLPSGLESAVMARSSRNSIEGMGLKRVLAVIASKGSDAPPSLETMIAQLKAASAANQPLVMMMIFLNMTQQYGDELLSDPASKAMFSAVRPDVQRVMANPLVIELMSANAVAGERTPGRDRTTVARYWASGDRFDALPFGTFRFVAYANLVRLSGDTSGWDPLIAKSMPAITDCYWKHIASYPWAGNAFKDLGDSYLQEFDTANAWLAWDLGRFVDQRSRPSLLSQVDSYEQHLRRTMPDSF